ncbi:MAG: response regulator transcription factor [Myxococcales bacterium]|nr:response regulator transcription factor [Myxococcales bacterium]
MLASYAHSAGDGSSVALLVSRPDGRVVQQNGAARALLGEVEGRPCWRAMQAAGGGAALPCAIGCVGRLVEAGADAAVSGPVELAGRRYSLCCVPAADGVVTTLTGGDATPAPWERPTPREDQVLRLLAAGLTTPDIAAELAIAEKTARAHVEHLRQKLAVPTRAALVARAFALGLLP